MFTLRLLWILLVLVAELGFFFSSFLSCNWPVLLHTDSTRVLLVADTQIWQQQQQPNHPNAFRRFLFHLNLRKSWRVTSFLNPDAVVFLGDMLSDAKSAKTHQEYKAAVLKFKSIFHTNPRTQVFYVAGNNDIGLGLDRSTSRLLTSSYQEFFGPLEHTFVLRNHTFIAINSAGLVDEDYLRNGRHIPFRNWTPLPDGTISFVNRVAQSTNRSDPVILLSHIPLARADSARCGALRDYGTIRRGAGPGWQNTLSKQSTHFLLDTLRPSIVFSADNRDYCDYTHISHHQDHSSLTQQLYQVREITLKSFSLSAHIRRPGFQLLSLVDPTSTRQHGFAERTCFLPDQYGIYNFLYAPFFALTVLYLARFPFLKLKKGQFRSKRPHWLGVKTGTQSRTTDEDTPNVLPESPSSLCALPSSVTPRSAQVWTPFTPFTPVTPFGMQTRQLSMTSVTSVESIGHSSVSSITLLDGEKEYYFPNVEDDQEDFIGYDYYSFHDERSSSKAEKISGLISSKQRYQQRPDSGFAFRHPYNRQSSICELEAYQNEMVDDDQIEISPAKFTKGADLISTHQRRRIGFLPSWLSHWNLSLFRVRLRFRSGRRATRQTIRFGLSPSWNALWNLAEFFGIADSEQGFSLPSLLDQSRRRRKNGILGFVVELVVVFWPSMVLWVVINGTFMLF